MTRVMDTWFEMGVDGMRLDAVPYLYEEARAPVSLRLRHDLLERLEKLAEKHADFENFAHSKVKQLNRNHKQPGRSTGDAPNSRSTAG